MPKAQQLIDGLLTGFPPPTLSVMKEALAKSWGLVSNRYQGVDAAAQGRLRLASAIVAVTPRDAADVNAVSRMAIDLLNIEERESSSVIPIAPTSNVKAGD